MRGVLDTSTVIMLSRISNPADLPAEPLITAVTVAELSVGPLVATDESERAARQAHVQQAEADFDPLPFDAAAARAFSRRRRFPAAGRKQAVRASTRCHDRRDRPRQRTAGLHLQPGRLLRDRRPSP